MWLHHIKSHVGFTSQNTWNLGWGWNVEFLDLQVVKVDLYTDVPCINYDYLNHQKWKKSCRIILMIKNQKSALSRVEKPAVSENTSGYPLLVPSRAGSGISCSNLSWHKSYKSHCTDCSSTLGCWEFTVLMLEIRLLFSTIASKVEYS